jgi:hypothetical protein
VCVGGFLIYGIWFGNRYMSGLGIDIGGLEMK